MRAGGSHRVRYRFIRLHGRQWVWLRRRSTRRHNRPTSRRKRLMAWPFIGTPFHSPHWEVNRVRTFAPFFRALPSLVPPDSVLRLAQGHPNSEIKAFFAKHRCAPPARIVRPRNFKGREHVLAAPLVLTELATVSERHAEPEIAICLSASCADQQILEWFDTPRDSFSVSLDVPDARVAESCGKLGAHYRGE